MPATALIIDDEADIRELIALTLSRMGLDFHTAANLEEARNLLNTYKFDLCLTDMRLPDGNGVEFVRYVQSTQPQAPVAVITAHGNMEAAVEAMKNGAYDFVSKPVDINQLRKLVTQAVSLSARSNQGDDRSAANDDTASAELKKISDSESSNQETPVANNTNHRSSHTSNDGNGYISTSDETESDNRNKHQSLEQLSQSKTGSKRNLEQAHIHNQMDYSPSGTQLIGESGSVHELRAMIEKVSRTNAPIWITGESGTGKELIARLIHERGPRNTHSFVAVNCGAIPTNLMESELFGHRKGSFTGATSDHDGLFVQAEGGTLFLDEVAELPLQMQVKLLRAIQERSVRPVGGTKETKVDVRILSASHIDLAKEVDTGRFRHDLYYRLNVISLRSPSLRDRISDIPLLVNHLLDKLQKSSGIENISIDQNALSKLCGYNFPGNVRELENILERAATMMSNSTIHADDIHLPDKNDSNASSQRISDGSRFSSGSGSGSGSTIQSVTNDSRVYKPNDNTSEHARLIEALNETRWNRKAAAEKLGLTYRQLRYRIQQLGIDKTE